jgi:hypothetical protein
VERAAPELRVVRRLAGWTGADDPLAALSAIEKLVVDASADAPVGADRQIDLEVAVTLASRPHRGGR